MVNGTLMETALDTMSNPMAIPRGFRSGLASATIFRKEDALLVVSCASAGSSLLHSDFFGEEVGLFDDESDGDGVELDVIGDEEHRADEENCRRARASSGHGGLETCRAKSAGGESRRVGAARRMRARKTSMVEGRPARRCGRRRW